MNCRLPWIRISQKNNRDYYPLPDIFPWVSCIFVSEEYRGQKISGDLIAYANKHLEKNGFSRSYIPTGIVGLYEHYGYKYLKDIVNYGGGTDHLFVKDFRETIHFCDSE